MENETRTIREVTYRSTINVLVKGQVHSVGPYGVLIFQDSGFRRLIPWRLVEYVDYDPQDTNFQLYGNGG